MKQLPTLFVLLLLVTVNDSLLGQAGQVDPNFGNFGWSYRAFNDWRLEARKIRVQADGKALIQADEYLVRFLPDGTEDVLFTNTGFVPNVAAFDLQADGHILILYVEEVSNNLYELKMQQLEPSGAVNRDFGQNGEVSLRGQFNVRFTDEFFNLVVRPDGKIIVMAYENGNTLTVKMAQYLPDGSLDTGWGSFGVMIPQSIFFEVRVSVLPDNALVMFGNCDQNSRCMVKLTPDGQLDPSFGNGGIAGIPGNFTLVRAIATQPDGKILLGGCSKKDADGFRNFLLTRHLPNGQLDASFGIRGTAETDFDIYDDEIRAIAVQPDGKIIAAGMQGGDDCFDPHGNIRSFGIARYLPDGQLDRSFSFDGTDSQRPPERGGAITAVALTPSGRIIVAGGYEPGLFNGDNYTLFVVRYMNDLQLTSRATRGQPIGNLITHLFPNPSTGRLTLSLAHAPQPTDWYLLNAKGQTVRRGTVYSSKQELDFTTVPAGMYHIKVVQDHKQAIQSVMIQP